MQLMACNFTESDTPQKLLSTDIARGVIFVQYEIIGRTNLSWSNKIKTFIKNALFQNALKILDEPNGGVAKISRPVNLEKILES